MRLWHKELIPFLPRQQIISQWRECCCIAKNIYINGTPNHILVNKIIDYDITHFISYTNLVIEEIRNRGYKINASIFLKYISKADYLQIPFTNIYNGWHNNIYLRECLYNLEEKAMCGGISKIEWDIIYNQFSNDFQLWQMEY